jgi:diguanylate cyclase (GGDEF)-like protein
MDLDGLKAINALHGKAAGDAVLSGLARRCREILRRTDHIGRLAGEEFAVVLPNTDASGALLLAGSVQAELARARLSHRGSPTGWVTVSIGIAAARPDATNDSSALVAAADRALYAAKAAGRNRIVSAPDGPPAD